MINKLKTFNAALNDLTNEVNKLYELDLKPSSIIDATTRSDELNLQALSRLIFSRKHSNYEWQLNKLSYCNNCNLTSEGFGNNQPLERRLLVLKEEFDKAMLRQVALCKERALRYFDGKSLTIPDACEYVYDWNIRLNIYKITYKLNPEFLNELISVTWGIENAYIIGEDWAAWNNLRANELKHELFNVKCFKNGNVKISLKNSK